MTGILVANQLLEGDDFLALAAFCAAQPMSYGWQSNKEINFAHWNVDFVHAPGQNVSEDLSPALPGELRPVWNAIADRLGPSTKLVRCYLNGNTHGTEGYLHVDDEAGDTQTTIVYVNPKWTPHWGGETIFYDGALSTAIGVVCPAPGRSVTFPGNIPHKAAPVSRICPELRLTLVFKTVGPQGAPDLYESQDTLRQFLLKHGVDKMPHGEGEGTLADHLMRVYLILMGAGAPEHVALAGGLHSVYGTNQYRVQAIEPGSIRVEFDHAAAAVIDSLVMMYGYIDRPRALETPDGTLDDESLEALRMIECANLYDQGQLRDWPVLNAFAVEKLKERG